MFLNKKAQFFSLRLNIAHRGVRSLAPENTIAASRMALEIGADLWEFDVQVTCDKKLIVVHDDTLSRTSNVRMFFPNRKPWLVRDFTLEEIRGLDFGSWYNSSDPFGQIAAGNVPQKDQKSYIGELAPTLREALEFTKKNNWRANIEIKNIPFSAERMKVIKKIVNFVEEFELEEEVIISSFNHEYLTWVKKLNSHIATGVLVDEPLHNPAKYLNMIGADFYHPKASAINLEIIGSLWRQGYGVNVWTVNDEKLMVELIDAAVSGIITDFPQRLKTISMR